jgi:hypothetical protein
MKLLPLICKKADMAYALTPKTMSLREKIIDITLNKSNQKIDYQFG